MSITVPTSGSSATTSVTIPAHQVGDMIVIMARGTVAPTIPAAGGTVPTFTEIGTGGVNNSVGWRVARAIATATNHTSGTWTNAAQMHVLVLRASAGTLSVGNAPAQAGANNTQTIVYPAHTLTTGKADALVVRCGARGVADTEVRTDGAFTTGGTFHTEQPATTPTSATFSKTVTASEGSFSATPVGSNAAYRAVTFEILETISKSGSAACSAATQATASGQKGGQSSEEVYAPKVMAKGPQLYWRCGEASGSAQDQTANDRDGTLGATVTRGVAGALAGDTDTAYEFTGFTTSVVTSSYNPFAANGQITLAVWALRDEMVGSETIVGADGADDPKWRFDGALDRISWEPEYLGVGLVRWSSVGVGTGAYAFLVLTYNDATQTAELFVNGVSQGSLVVSGSGFAASPGNVSLSDASEAYDGKFDEFAVWTRTLSVEEIEELYRVGVEGPDPAGAKASAAARCTASGVADSPVVGSATASVAARATASGQKNVSGAATASAASRATASGQKADSGTAAAAAAGRATATGQKNATGSAAIALDRPTPAVFSHYVYVRSDDGLTDAWNDGNFTIASLVKSNDSESDQLLLATYGADGSDAHVYFLRSNNQLSFYNGLENSFGPVPYANGTDAENWWLWILTKTAGVTTPRFHMRELAPGAFWSHDDGDTAIGDPTDNVTGGDLTGGYVVLGVYDVGGVGSAAWFFGEYGLSGYWAGVTMSDAEVEELGANLATSDWHYAQGGPTFLTELIEDPPVDIEGALTLDTNVAAFGAPPAWNFDGTPSSPVTATGQKGGQSSAAVTAAATVTATGTAEEEEVEEHSGSASVSARPAATATGQRGATAAATASAAARTTATGTKNAAGAATCQARPTCTATGQEGAASAATASAAPRATATGQKGGQSAATCQAAARVTASGAEGGRADIVISARATATATGTKNAAGAATCRAAARVTATGSESTSDAVTVSARPTVTASGQKGAQHEATVSARPRVTATIADRFEGSASSSVRPTCSASGVKGGQGAAAASATPRAQASGQKAASGAASVSAAATVTAAHTQTAAGSASMSAAARATGSGAKNGRITVSSSAGAAASASGAKQGAGRATVSARATATAVAGARTSSGASSATAHARATASGAKDATGSAQISAAVTVAATPLVVVVGTATVSAAANVTATGGRTVTVVYGTILEGAGNGHVTVSRESVRSDPDVAPERGHVRPVRSDPPVVEVGRVD